MLDRDFIELQHALAGEYSLERELGRGGMGIVYLARELQLERLVAIKLLPGALAARMDTLWLASTGIHRQALGVPFNGELDPQKTNALLDGYPVRPHFAAPGLV